MLGIGVLKKRRFWKRTLKFGDESVYLLFHVLELRLRGVGVWGWERDDSGRSPLIGF